MDKYNDELDLTTKNSLSCIIGMIKPNSRILEFGPAYGRLTKYLRNVMACSVDIVEINEISGMEAAKYAKRAWVGAVEGNIENFKWLETGEIYDYVIFSDVLEHLFSPEQVLEKAKEVLGSKGSILISIPNICHNAILANLYNNEFNYTKVGLLDNTHIRFWGLRNLENMCHDLDLCIDNIDALYIPMMNTEQGCFIRSINQEFQELLSVREFGDAYQFVVKLSKNEEGKVGKKLIHENSGIMSLYINTGDGYSETLKLSKEIIIGEPTKVSFDLQEFVNIVSIRIDPAEGLKSKIEGLRIVSEQGPETVVPLNDFFYDDNEVWFDSTDPNFELSVHNTIKWIDIELTINPIRSAEIIKKKDEISRNMTNKLSEFEAKIFESEEKLVESQLQLTEVNRCFLDSQKLIAELNEQLCDSKSQLSQMKVDCIEAKADLEQKQIQLVQIREELTVTLNELTQTQAYVNSILKSLSWRITKPLRIMKQIIRRIFTHG